MIPENELILLDTNVLVACIRANALAGHIDTTYGLLKRADKPLICVVTEGEITSLADKLGWGHDRRDRLRALLNELVVVDINVDDVIDRYAEIDYFLSTLKPAVTIQQNDMWIAAVASVAKAHLLTTDKDFQWLAPEFLKLHWIDESLARL